MVKRKGAAASLRLSQGVLKLLILALLLIIPSKSYSETPPPESKTVDATGVATVSDNNSALARDSALGDALRMAVEQAVGAMVSSETMVENYMLLKDSIYTKTQGYIKEYKVVNESQEQSLYKVTVRATVSSGQLKDDLSALGLLHWKVERPRVLFMIAERNIGHKFYSFWWWGKSEYKGETVDMSAAETALKEIFLNKGFNIVDISGSMENFEVSNIFKVADLTKDGARKIGKTLNAEVVVFGKAMAKEGPRTPDSTVGVYLADITAQAVRVDDGVVLASSRGHGTSRHISDVTGGTEALSRASEDLAEKMIDQITAKWTGPGSVTVRVSGITEFKKLTEFKNALKGKVRGVQAIYQRRFENGVAVLDVESKITAQNLAEEISRLGMPLKVTNTTQNTIYLNLEGGKN